MFRVSSDPRDLLERIYRIGASPKELEWLEPITILRKEDYAFIDREGTSKQMERWLNSLYSNGFVLEKNASIEGAYDMMCCTTPPSKERLIISGSGWC